LGEDPLQLLEPVYAERLFRRHLKQSKSIYLPFAYDFLEQCTPLFAAVRQVGQGETFVYLLARARGGGYAPAMGFYITRDGAELIPIADCSLSDWKDTGREYFSAQSPLLDLSCGLGGRVASLRRLGVEAWGVDPSVFAPTPYLVCGFSSTLPFQDEAFGEVQGFHSFLSCTQSEAALRAGLTEVHRVLKPQGVLALSPRSLLLDRCLNSGAGCFRFKMQKSTDKCLVLRKGSLAKQP
jgi:SAM-dependent methyltransferase